MISEHLKQAILAATRPGWSIEVGSQSRTAFSSYSSRRDEELRIMERMFSSPDVREDKIRGYDYRPIQFAKDLVKEAISREDALWLRTVQAKRDAGMSPRNPIYTMHLNSLETRLPSDGKPTESYPWNFDVRIDWYLGNTVVLEAQVLQDCSAYGVVEKDGIRKKMILLRDFKIQELYAGRWCDHDYISVSGGRCITDTTCQICRHFFTIDSSD